MQVDTAMVAILVTVFLAIIATAFGYGILTQKVKSNRVDINDSNDNHDKDISEIRKEFREYQRDNKEDHKLINGKLDKILQNGKGA